MKILIFDDSPVGIALRDELNKERKIAILCNPQYFRKEEIERNATKVYADDARIQEAYSGLGIAVEALRKQTEVAPASSAPKVKKKK